MGPHESARGNGCSRITTNWTDSGNHSWSNYCDRPDNCGNLLLLKKEKIK